jgi:integrase
LQPLIARHLDLFPAAAVTLPYMDGTGKVTGTMTRRLIFHNGPLAWYTGTFDDPWARAVERARKAGTEFPGKNTPHVLRHTAATNWLANGLNLAAVAAYLGDTKETILKTYSHVLPNDDEAAREIMNRFFRCPRDEKTPRRRLTGE